MFTEKSNEDKTVTRCGVSGLLEQPRVATPTPWAAFDNDIDTGVIYIYICLIWRGFVYIYNNINTRYDRE